MRPSEEAKRSLGRCLAAVKQLGEGLAGAAHASAEFLPRLGVLKDEALDRPGPVAPAFLDAQNRELGGLEVLALEQELAARPRA